MKSVVELSIREFDNREEEMEKWKLRRTQGETKQPLHERMAQHRREEGKSIYVKLERPSLKRGGGLRRYLSPTYNAVASFLPRQLNSHSHLDSPSSDNPHESRLGQLLSMMFHLTWRCTKRVTNGSVIWNKWAVNCSCHSAAMFLFCVVWLNVSRGWIKGIQRQTFGQLHTQFLKQPLEHYTLLCQNPFSHILGKNHFSGEHLRTEEKWIMLHVSDVKLESNVVTEKNNLAGIMCLFSRHV